VESEEQLKKFQQVPDQCRTVKFYVVWDTAYRPPMAAANIYAWADFIALGKDEAAGPELAKRISALRPGKCCTLIYTSGTTGMPKGVMLTHDNLMWTTRVGVKFLQLTENDHFVSYLPLSHIAAQIFELHAVYTGGLAVTFAQPDALRGGLKAVLQEARPTMFLGVPRVYEK